MTTLHDTEVDDVRCFWVDTGRPTLAASLIFRQGMCDEPLVESGWLHMLEHLALHGRGGGSLSINGSVSPLYTTFDAHGPAEAVARHFSDVAAWLAAPKLENLEHERGVLRAEASGRGGAVGSAFAWRFGARGPGVVSHNEAGIGRATADALTERSHRVFTKGNAVIVFDGPPPDGLTLGLTEGGSVLKPAVAVPCDDILPGAYTGEAGVVLSGLVPRSTSATVVPMVLQRILRERLRDKAGAAYAPWGTYEAVDDDTALVIAGSDINDELLPTIVKTAVEIVQTVQSNGLPAAHVSEAVDLLAQSVADPYNSFGLAVRAAYAVTNGRKPESLESVLEEIHGVDAGTLAEPTTAFANTFLLGIPGASSWDKELAMLTVPSRDIREKGRKFRNQDWPASGLELYVGDVGVQVSGKDTYRSARTEDVEAMYTYTDGARHIVTADGWGLSIEADEWTKGTEAVALIDRLIAGDKQLPQPARTGRRADQRKPFLRRWWGGLVRVVGEKQLRWIWIALFIVLIGVAVALRGYVLAFVAAVWVVRLGNRSWKRRNAAGLR